MEAFIQFTFIGAICMFVIVFLWFVTAYLRQRTNPSSFGGGQTLVNVQGVTYENKREHHRAGIKWPIRINTPQGPMEAETKDISLGGAFVLCEHPLASGETFRMSIDVPEHEPIEATAQVAWSNLNVPEEQIVARGMGITFTQISAQDRQFVSDAIKAYIEENEE